MLCKICNQIVLGKSRNSKLEAREEAASAACPKLLRWKPLIPVQMLEMELSPDELPDSFSLVLTSLLLHAWSWLSAVLTAALLLPPFFSFPVSV